MENEIEIEKTYLAKFLPRDLMKFSYTEIIDLYFPKNSKHPKLRIRKRDNSYTITKKNVIDEKDSSTQREQNIKITKEEFDSFFELQGNKIHKIRFLYPCKGKVAEIDVFLGRFKGLVLVEVEFDSKEELEKASMPDFCLADVTEEECIAGGFLSTIDFDGIKEALDKFNFKKLSLEELASIIN